MCEAFGSFLDPREKKVGQSLESDQFRFLRAASYANIKGSVGLILAKASAMRISTPLDTCHLGLLYHCRASFVRDALVHF
jgi:hypothetical protein